MVPIHSFFLLHRHLAHGWHFQAFKVAVDRKNVQLIHGVKNCGVDAVLETVSKAQTCDIYQLHADERWQMHTDGQSEDVLLFHIAILYFSESSDCSAGNEASCI